MANSGVPSLLAVDVKSNSLDHDNLDGHDDQDYSNDYFVRIRGLPFSATIEDILEFFTGSYVFFPLKVIALVQEFSLSEC